MVEGNVYIEPIDFRDWFNRKNKLSTSNDEDLEYIANTEPEWYIRALAVNKIDDESILFNIAVNNSSDYVSRLAVRKIRNDNLLKEIVESSKVYDVREEALSQIRDENILLDFAENERNYNIRYHSIKNIKNDSLLVPFVEKRLKDFNKENRNQSELYDLSKEYSLCEIAIERINDESFLKDIVTKNYKQYMSIKALKNIHDQEFLIDIALNHSDVNYRISAIENISDDDVLIDFAKNDKRRFVREEAIGKISNQSIAVDIIRNDREIEVDKLDIQHIDDKLLFELVKGESSWLRRTYFVKAIQNAAYLKDIVYNDVDSHVCKTAVEKIYDDAFLKELFNHDFSREVLEAALKNIHDEAFLKDIFNNTEYGLAALKNITDESFLIPIALNNKDARFREEALENIYDELVLDQIALSDPQMHVRMKAVSKISNDFVLVNISKMDMGFQEYSRPYCVIYLVRQEALSRLKELVENPEIEIDTQNVDVIQSYRYELDNKKMGTGLDIRVENEFRGFGSSSLMSIGVIGNFSEESHDDKRDIVLEDKSEKPEFKVVEKYKKDVSASKDKIEKPEFKVVEKYKKDVLITLVGFDNQDLFKEGSVFKIVKEPDNEYDMEAIAVEFDGKRIAYLANSVNTVVRGTMSSGRIYDMFDDEGEIEIIFVGSQIIAKLIV